MNQDPIWVLLMKKNGGGKPRATFPLMSADCCIQSGVPCVQSALYTQLTTTVPAALQVISSLVFA
jgi:hypothetical protein